MNQRLLAVLAHPDDESFGPGGTFARYAAEATAVHIAIATDGAAGSVVPSFDHLRDQLPAIRAEELNKAVAILGATLHTLDYADSGYIGDAANQNPAAFINADEYEAVGKVVRLIRQIRPQVVITHDETGGYMHPDHIFCWKITTAAFHAAGDAAQYPEIGLPPYQPQRLYYTVFSNRWLKFVIFGMRLVGKDPTKIGRNQDIDLTQIGVDASVITTVIDYKPYWAAKVAASRAHASQGGGAGYDGPGRFISDWILRQLWAKDAYMLAYPPTAVARERDLFAAVDRTR